MDVRSKRLPGLPILTLTTGKKIGRIQRPLIDPENKKIAGFLVSGRRLEKNRFLPMQAVHALGSHAVTIDSDEVVIDLEDGNELDAFVKERQISLVGSPVVTAGGELLGRVHDYEIGPGGDITGLLVHGGFWPMSRRGTLVPGRLLLAVGPDAAVVAEDAQRLVKSDAVPAEAAEQEQDAEEQASKASVAERWRATRFKLQDRLQGDDSEPPST